MVNFLSEPRFPYRRHIISTKIDHFEGGCSLDVKHFLQIRFLPCSRNLDSTHQLETKAAKKVVVIMHGGLTMMNDAT